MIELEKRKKCGKRRSKEVVGSCAEGGYVDGESGGIRAVEV